MYHAIVDAVKKAGKAYKIKMIIPTGTAIQNARTSFIGDHMNRDGHHLMCPDVIGCRTWFERIFKRNNREMSGIWMRLEKLLPESHAAVKHP